jgi:iron complex transport system ATP-binding protein
MRLAVRNLTLKRGEKAVVMDANLSFERGRVTAILGPNGAGKTSLIRGLSGLLAPSNGNVTLNNKPLPPIAERARRIGYLPQNGSPAWNITVRELVGLGRLPHRARLSAPTPADHSAIEAALAATDTAHLADRTVDTLSGGERARASLARVLAGEPDWIIADEPLANLDPPHQRDVLNLLRMAAAEGKGVIVVLHQLNAAARVADDVVFMKDARILASGPSDSTLTAETLAATFGMDFALIDNDGATLIAPR